MSRLYTAYFCPVFVFCLFSCLITSAQLICVSVPQMLWPRINTSQDMMATYSIKNPILDHTDPYDVSVDTANSAKDMTDAHFIDHKYYNFTEQEYWLGPNIIVEEEESGCYQSMDMYNQWELVNSIHTNFQRQYEKFQNIDITQQWGIGKWV